MKKNKIGISLLLVIAMLVSGFTSVFAADEIAAMDSKVSDIYINYEKRDPNSEALDTSKIKELPLTTKALAKENPVTNKDAVRAAAMVTGGYELPYDPTYWNSAAIINKANCYAYSLNVYVNIENYKLQPGEVSGNTMSLDESSIFSCMQADLTALGRTCRRSSYGEVPGVNEYKTALVIAPNADYHFYRQDSDAGWSHKRGLTALDYRDASLQYISDPYACDRNYGGSYNYSTWCNYYIISY